MAREEDLAATTGSDVIDQVERPADDIQGGGEPTAVSEPTEGVHDRHQGTHDDVAE